jgi:hypothetical protein
MVCVDDGDILVEAVGFEMEEIVAGVAGGVWRDVEQ